MTAQAQPLQLCTPTSRWQVVLFALVVVLTQALLAVHAAEHLTNQVYEACDICIVGGGLDQTVLDTSLRGFTNHPNSAVSPPHNFLPSSEHAAPFRQRAPPDDSLST
jgi:hypothetical protein